jgi:hypothetical protein
MLVSLALLGIIAAVVTPAIRRLTPPPPNDPMTIIADTMVRVMATGRPATLEFTVNARRVLATLNPDGGVVADTALHIERFTGRSTRVR